jgi:Tetratricopeptide repeat
VHTDSYGLVPVDRQAQLAGPAGDRVPGVAWPVRSGRVPPLAEGFIPRPDTVPGLEAALVPGAAVALVPGQARGDTRDWSISSGKTQLAAYVADFMWRSRTVELLAWVTATSRASVLSAYGQAAAELGLDHGGDARAVAARFAAWLDGTSRPWLVVLDDLADAADLEGLWPAGPAGRVLITAADPAAVSGEPQVLVLPVPGFSTREALNYLNGRLSTDPDQRSGAIGLAADLGCEPPALAHAAAVIISSGIRCRQYRDYFIQRQAQPAAGGGEPPTSAGLTWTVSAAHAEQLAPGAGTWRLLVLTALLDGHGIPGTVVTAPATCRYLAGQEAADPPDPQQAWPALLALQRAGLLAIDAAGTPPAVWVSPALQAAARAVAPPELLDQAARAAADALLEAWPEDRPQSPLAAALRACAANLRQNAGNALWAGGCPRLLLTTGQSLDAAGLAGPAVTWWRQMAADSGKILGPGHPDTVLAGGLLAAALLAAGQAAEAVTWFGWLLAGRASMLGPDHPAAIAAQVSLGRALVAAGRPGDAITGLEAAAARSERARGSGDAATAAAREEYAAACLAAGKTSEAIRCCKRLLADSERLRGPGHRETLAIRLRLADAYLAAGKTKDAIIQHKTILAGREHALGPDHPDTLAARAGLAAACDAAGQMSAALQFHQEACAGYERVFGADHPDTLPAVGTWRKPATPRARRARR